MCTFSTDLLSRTLGAPQRPLRALLRAHHLTGENEEKAKEQREQQAETEQSAANRDYQLRSALNLLKGMRILNRKDDSGQQGKDQ